MSKYGFKKGFGMVKNKDAQIVRNEIMAALGINSRTQWYQRLNGDIIPNVMEAEKIEEIFKKHGVTKKIWG